MAYLESGNQSSCVSSVDSSVSVDVPEWAWFGVDGRLVFNNRRHVQRRSVFFFFGKSNFIVSLIFLLKFVINFYLVEAVDLTNRLPIHSLVHLDYCYHCRISFVVGAPINAQLANMWLT